MNDGDVFVVGGGDSLREFPWHRLQSRRVVGTNDAFRLGPEVCPICIFGDTSWWQAVKHDLHEYGKRGGIIYSISTSTANWKIPYVRQLKRVKHGLHTDDHLAWNYSTGAAAVNLAINLGARRVFLLGYDLTVSPEGRSHWHDYRYRPGKITQNSYNEFLKGFKDMALAMKKQCPEVAIYNVTPEWGKLNEFFRISLPEMWELADGPR